MTNNIPEFTKNSILYLHLQAFAQEMLDKGMNAVQANDAIVKLKSEIEFLDKEIQTLTGYKQSLVEKLKKFLGN